MKTQKHLIVLFVVSISLSVVCQAQNAITGTILNYAMGDEGLLSSYDMISRERIPLSNIDQKGNFNIPLDENYLTTIQEKAIQAQEKALDGWKLKFHSVATSFECMDGEMQYVNGEALIIGIPDPEVTDKEGKQSSIMYAVNQPEIAQWLYSYGQSQIVTGYYLQWYFVAEAASAKGECIVLNYTGNDEEHYDKVTVTNLELQKGWNIIKYEITEVFTDVNGETVPSKMVISTIPQVPIDIQWITVTQ